MASEVSAGLLLWSYTTWAEARGLPVPGGERGYARLVAIVQALFWQVYAILGYLGVIAVLVILGLPEVPAIRRKFRNRCTPRSSANTSG